MATLPTKSQFTDQSDTQDQFKTAMNQLIDYLAGYQPFPSGTRIVFQQSTAPTGWTKDVTSPFADAALRVVTGAISTGGADAFSALFGTAKSTAGYTLQVADIPAHAHGVSDPGHAHEKGFLWNVPGVSFNTGSGVYMGPDNTASDATNISIQNTGGGGPHSHTLNQMNLKFVDTIVASKD